MTSRTILSTVGAAALGLGVIIGGTTMPNVLAQDAPATTEAPAQAAANEPEARFAEAYDQFVATLASELNAEDAAVDAAIRTALKAQVAALETDGVLDAEQVTEIQQQIDESEVPFGFGMGGPGRFGERGGMHGFGGPGKEHRGSRGGFGGWENGPERPGQAPVGESAPATLPAADDAADQSVPDSAAPVEDGAAA